MKIEQQPKEFQPITITLESHNEVVIFAKLIGAAETCFGFNSIEVDMAKRILKGVVTESCGDRP